MGFCHLGIVSQNVESGQPFFINMAGAEMKKDCNVEQSSRAVFLLRDKSFLIGGVVSLVLLHSHLILSDLHQTRE